MFIFRMAYNTSAAKPLTKSGFGFIWKVLITVLTVLVVLLMVEINSMRNQLDTYDLMIGKMLELHKMETDRLDRLDGRRPFGPPTAPQQQQSAPRYKDGVII